MLLKLIFSALVFAPSLSLANTIKSNQDTMTTIQVDNNTDTTPTIDGVTGASTKIDSVTEATQLSIVEWPVINEKELTFLVNEMAAICLISTTNPDNSPHIATIRPVFETDKIIKFAAALTQTRKNIDRNGTAILTVLAGSSDPRKKRAAKVILRQAGNVDETSKKTKGLRLLRMKVVNVFPLQGF